MDGIGPYRSFGMLHCPVCFMRTEFVSFDTTVEDVNDAECCICGHSFGHVRDDTHPGEPPKPVIGPNVARKAWGEHLRFQRHVLRSTDVDPDVAAAYQIAAQTQQRRQGMSDA